MTDARLRSAARAAETGDTEAAARLLLERVRAGRLSRERLELAAYCGSDAARIATGSTVRRWKDGYLCCCGDLDRDHGNTVDTYTHSPVHACTYVGSKPDDVSNDHDESLPCDCELTEHTSIHDVVHAPERFGAWVDGLRRWAPAPVHALARAAIVSAYDAAKATEQRTRFVMSVLVTAEKWARCPCEHHAEAWAALQHNAATVPPRWLPCPPIAGSVCGSEHEHIAAIHDAARLAGGQPVREAIYSAITRWALDGEA